MGIGGVTATNSMSGTQMVTAASTDPKDPKSKSIENEITDVTQEMQKLSSKGDLSANEKSDERKKLQKEIASLNTKLEQYQEQISKSQKREIMLAELQEDKGLTKEEKPEDKIQTKETSSDKADEKNLTADKQQTGRQGTVIAENSDGIAMIKGEMNPDEKRGVNTGKTQDETEEDSAEKETKSIDRDKDTDVGMSRKEMHAMVSADSSVQQVNRQGSIIARTRDGIAILKAEIDQDEKRGIDTEKKRDELEEMEKKEQRAIAFQSSILGEANRTMKSAAETDAAKAKDQTGVTAEGNAFVNALKASQEEGLAAQQRFHVSIG